MASVLARPTSGSSIKLIYISASSRFWLSLGMHRQSVKRLLPSMGMEKARSGLSAIMVTASPL